MKSTKFKTNDRVRILGNDIQPQFNGKVGKVKKAYVSFSESDNGAHISCYRIEVDGNVLKGIALDSDLELA